MNAGAHLESFPGAFGRIGTPLRWRDLITTPCESLCLLSISAIVAPASYSSAVLLASPSVTLSTTVENQAKTTGEI